VVAVLALALPATVFAALPADVAVVAGKPVKRHVFNHWMFVIVKSASSPGEPAIVPTDPPRCATPRRRRSDPIALCCSPPRPKTCSTS